MKKALSIIKTWAMVVLFVFYLTSLAQALPTIVVDNPYASCVGSWSTGIYPSQQYGDDFLYTDPDEGTCTVTWIPDLP